MAIDTPTVLTQGSSGTDSSSYSTASVTPTANALVLLCVNTGVSSGTNAAPTSVTGNGLTWELVDSSNSANGTMNTSVWRAMGASPSAGAVTVNLGATISNAAWQVVQITNVDTSGTNGSGACVQSQTGTSTSTSPSITLGSGIGSGNGVIGVIGYNAGSAQAITAGSGYTLLGAAQSVTSPTIQAQSEYDVTGTTTVAFGTANASQKVLIGVEIADLAAITQFGTASATATAAPSATGFVERPASASTTATAAPTASATVLSAKTNLIPNPSFEVGLSTWNQTSGHFVRDNSGSPAVPQGSWLVLNPFGSSEALYTDVIPVTAGTVYTLSAYISNASGAAAHLDVDYFTSGLGSLGSDLSVVTSSGSTIVRRSGQFTPPSTAAYARVTVYASSSVSLVYVDGVMLTEGSTLEPYFDGDTPDDTTYIYAWTGTPHASASTRTPSTLKTIVLADKGTTATGSGGTILVPFPTGLTNTDALVMQVGVAGTSITTPSGWTLIGLAFDTLTATGLYLRMSDGTETGNVTVGTATGASEGRIFRYTGVDASTPQDLSAVTTTASNAGGTLTFDVTALTTVTPGAVDIVAVRGRSSGDVTTSNGAYTEQDNTNNSAYYDHTQTVAGSTGTISVTVPTRASANNAAAVHAVLRPGVSTGATQTGSASQTATGTATAAGALTRVGSASQTATAAPSAAGTVTRPGSASQTATAAASATGGITKTATIFATLATASPSAAGDLTRVGSVSTTATAAPSAAASLVRGGSASQTAAAVATASGTVNHVGSASLTATAAPTADDFATRPSTASQTGVAAPSAAGAITDVGAASTTAVAAPSASATATHAGVASATATASPTAAGSLVRGAAASATATAAPSAAGNVTRPASVSLTATAATVADGLASGAGRGEITVTAAPTASANAVYNNAAAQTTAAAATADGVLTRGGVAQTSVSASATAAGASGPVGVASQTATAATSADGVVTRAGAASTTATAAPTASATRTQPGDASLTATVARPADGFPTHFGSANTVTGVANATAAGTAAGPTAGVAQLDVFAAPSADGVVTRPSSATVTGTGTGSASATAGRAGSTAASATAVLAAAGDVIRGAEAQLVVQGETVADGDLSAVSDQQLVTVGAIPLV